jgi:hypothetical protein
MGNGEWAKYEESAFNRYLTLTIHKLKHHIKLNIAPETIQSLPELLG